LYCFGDYDLTIIADVPNKKSMAAIALAIAAGDALKSAMADPTEIPRCSISSGNC
jgi:hypothetical protein